MNPVVRIVHFSDLHCAPRHNSLDARARSQLRRALTQAVQRLLGGTSISAEITKRIAGHDPTTWQELQRSIPSELARDTGWPKTHVVVTGDLSTWGDDLSVDQAKLLVDKIAATANVSGISLLYGNHDVWIGLPGQLAGFPLFCNGTNLDLRRTRLQRTKFCDPSTSNTPLKWPNVDRVAALPSGGGVFLVGVNTIEHGPVPNAVARGSVARDAYWEGVPRGDQLQTLSSLCTSGKLGIAFTHHPVHDTRPWVHLRSAGAPHVLGNANAVASALSSASGQAVHVILSGHTHETTPDFGNSNGGAPSPPHSPLSSNQVQLTAGTASQMQFGPLPQRKPHVWQLIQLYEDNGTVRVERIVFARFNGTGPFAAVATDPRQPSAIADVFTLAL